MSYVIALNPELDKYEIIDSSNPNEWKSLNNIIYDDKPDAISVYMKEWVQGMSNTDSKFDSSLIE